MSDLNRFEGKVAVVTAAPAGWGATPACVWRGRGAAVIVAGLPDDQRGAETVAEIEAAGGQARYVGVDVSRESDCDAMAQAAIDEFGRLDLCLAAAGISHAGYVSGEVTEGEPLLGGANRYVIHKPVEYWEKVLSVNLTGVMLTNRAVTRRMIAQGEGGGDCQHLLRRGRARRSAGWRTTASPKRASGC